MWYDGMMFRRNPKTSQRQLVFPVSRLDSSPNYWEEIRVIEGESECVNGTPQVTIVSTRRKVIHPNRLHIQEAAQFQSWAQRGWLSIRDETEREKKKINIHTYEKKTCTIPFRKKGATKLNQFLKKIDKTWNSINSPFRKEMQNWIVVGQLLNYKIFGCCWFLIGQELRTHVLTLFVKIKNWKSKALVYNAQCIIKQI